MFRAIPVTSLAIIGLAACGAQDAAGDGAPHAAASGACADAPAGELTVLDAWTRAAPANANSAAYLTICNRTDAAVALSAASTAAAGAVELHETTRAADGVVSMSPVATIEVEAGGASQLAPGGAHIMLLQLPAALEADGVVEITLNFDGAAPITTSADVRALGDHAGHGAH